MPSLCRVKLPVSSDWFDPSISQQYPFSSEAISRLAQTDFVANTCLMGYRYCLLAVAAVVTAM